MVDYVRLQKIISNYIVCLLHASTEAEELK